METFPRLLAICAGNSPVPGEIPAQRPVTRSFDVFLDLRLNKRLSKQSWGWWFEPLSCPLWRHCNGVLGGGWKVAYRGLKWQRQHRVCPPCTLTIVVHILRTEPMACADKSCERAFHTRERSLPSWCSSVVWWGRWRYPWSRWRNRRSISYHMCMILLPKLYSLVIRAGWNLHFWVGVDIN